MVYILHFNVPIAHARHYTGYCKDIARRLAQHRMGRDGKHGGARLTQVACERGIDFQLVYLEPGTRADERRLKRAKNAPRLCPICNKKGR
jgi:predicted GIY-YIG superfamily endonuclease